MVARQLGPAPRSSSAAAGDRRAKKQFAEQVKVYSERSKENHVFSGEHYGALASFFENAPPTHGWRTYSGTDSLFCPLYVHINKPGQEQTKVIAYHALHDILSNAAQVASAPEAHSSQLMIMRGWQSPEWLRIMAAQCKIDPEFFRRHLHFIEMSSYFDLPALPSASQNLWRVRINTICKKEYPLSARDVQEGRKGDLEDVHKYLNAIRASERVGSSIVRRHAVINETTSIIEQDISFCVQKKRSGGWIGLIWLDHGRPFDEDGQVPWLDKPNTKYSAHDPYIPVIQHVAKVALKPPDAHVFDMSDSANLATVQRSHMPNNQASQSTHRLAEQFGINLNRNLMRVDALYAFTELFTVSLSSENQFLNLIQLEIKTRARSFFGQEEACISTLSYCKGLLEEHADRLREMLALLETEDSNEWPKATDPNDLATREVALIAIRKDCEFLLRRCAVLARRAIHGADFIRNHAMLHASGRTISQTEEVRRISLLAYFFLPLSFVTSLFGMNFVEFGNWRDALITAICVFLVVMIVSLVVCFWDYMPWGKKKRGNSSIPWSS